MFSCSMTKKLACLHCKLPTGLRKFIFITLLSLLPVHFTYKKKKWREKVPWFQIKGGKIRSLFAFYAFQIL